MFGSIKSQLKLPGHQPYLLVWKTRTSAKRHYGKAKYIRNVAIIAHVDHGKTTLVDCLLRQSSDFVMNPLSSRLLDSNELEKERGITILSKCTTIKKGDHVINIVDTPGHADFGGEVERALTMVDGVILVVDATEGPMAQTKFVLSKALKQGLVPIVVQNKVDRDTVRIAEVDDELVDLFLGLDASDEQLDFSTVYASAKDGWAIDRKPDGQVLCPPDGNMSVLFDLIINKVPPPKVDEEGPFRMLVNSVENNKFVGKCLMGKIVSGRIAIASKIASVPPPAKLGDEESEKDSTKTNTIIAEENKVTKMFIRRGIDQLEITEASAGEIISLSGLQEATVNYTITDPSFPEALPIIPVDPPTVAMTFMVNDSPLAGREGKPFTPSALLDRLRMECDNNISLRLDVMEGGDSFKVSGRGELQLGILIETIRREGHELAVSPPEVLVQNRGGSLFEPIEEVIISCEMEFSGIVIEKLSKRKADFLEMTDEDGKCKMVFKCPIRGLIGYASELKNDTKGTGILSHSFLGYEEWKGAVENSRKGCMTSMASGSTTGYAISDLESRGVLFVPPNVKVYPGMVIGECNRPLDMEVNPTKCKQVTNVRSTSKDEFSRLSPAKLMNVEEMIAYMNEDEIMEVTPQSLRLRKLHLDSGMRKRMAQKRRAKAV